jgi:hypothetical protein
MCRILPLTARREIVNHSKIAHFFAPTHLLLVAASQLYGFYCFTFLGQQQARASATVTSDDSDSTLALLTSHLSILETLLKNNNIAIPTDSPPSPHSQVEGSVSAGGPPGDRAPGGDV